MLPAGELAAIQSTLAQFSNARLTKIVGTGAPGPRGETTEGTVLWTGSAPGYLAREDRSEVIDGRDVSRHADIFTITDEAGAPLIAVIGPRWQGTYVEIEDRRSTSVTMRWLVADLTHDMHNLVDCVVLELSNPAAT